MEKIEIPECCEECFHLIVFDGKPICGYPTNDHPNIDMKTLKKCPFEE